MQCRSYKQLANNFYKSLSFLVLDYFSKKGCINHFVRSGNGHKVKKGKKTLLAACNSAATNKLNELSDYKKTANPAGSFFNINTTPAMSAITNIYPHFGSFYPWNSGNSISNCFSKSRILIYFLSIIIYRVRICFSAREKSAIINFENFIILAYMIFNSAGKYACATLFLNNLASSHFSEESIIESFSIVKSRFLRVSDSLEYK